MINITILIKVYKNYKTLQKSFKSNNTFYACISACFQKLSNINN